MYLLKQRRNRPKYKIVKVVHSNKQWRHVAVEGQETENSSKGRASEQAIDRRLQS